MVGGALRWGARTPIAAPGLCAYLSSKIGGRNQQDVTKKLCYLKNKFNILLPTPRPGLTGLLLYVRKWSDNMKYTCIALEGDGLQTRYLGIKHNFCGAPAVVYVVFLL